MYSYGKNKDLISKEMGIFIGGKKLESFINKKNIYLENSGFRAIREKAA